MKKNIPLLAVLAIPMAHAQTTASAPPPPILTCNATSATPNAIKDLGQAFATAKAGKKYTMTSDGAERQVGTFADPNAPRSFWQANVEKVSFDPVAKKAIFDGVTGSRNYFKNGDLRTNDKALGDYGLDPDLKTAGLSAATWTVMGDSTTSGMNFSNAANDWKLGMEGNARLNPNPNVIFYYKFTFLLDPLANVDKFGIRIPGGEFTFPNGATPPVTQKGNAWSADDRIRGFYINDQLVSGSIQRAPVDASGTPVNLSDKAWNLNEWMAIPAGGHILPSNETSGKKLWKPGKNEIVIAVLNGGLPYPGALDFRTNSMPSQLNVAIGPNTSTPPQNYNYVIPDASGGTAPARNYPFMGMHTGISALTVMGASAVADCSAPAPVVSKPVPPIATLGTDTPLHFDGTVTNFGSATTVNVELYSVAADGTATLVGTFPAAIDQQTGKYTFQGSGPSGLPPGNYEAIAKLVDPISSTPLAVSADKGALAVPAIGMNTPASIPAGQTNTISGNVSYPGTATNVTVGVFAVAPDGSQTLVGYFPASINPADGSYSVTTGILPPGNYVTTATIDGVTGPSGPTASGSFIATGISVTPPPTVTTQDPATVTGTVQYPGTATTAHVVVTGPDGTKVFDGPVNLDVNGGYELPLGALGNEGTYTITATANGAVTTASFDVVKTAINVNPLPTADSRTPSRIQGTVTHPGTATTVDLTITDKNGQVVWQGTATLNPDGTYVTDAPALPEGDYTVTATANGSTATTALKVADPVVTVAVPPTLNPAQSPDISGKVDNPGTATQVTLSIKDDKGQVVWTGSATLNPDGTYSTTASPLPQGSYTVTASVNGKSADATFKVVAAAAAVTPVPTLGQWALMLLSGLLGALGIARSRRSVQE